MGVEFLDGGMTVQTLANVTSVFNKTVRIIWKGVPFLTWRAAGSVSTVTSAVPRWMSTLRRGRWRVPRREMQTALRRRWVAEGHQKQLAHSKHGTLKAWHAEDMGDC